MAENKFHVHVIESSLPCLFIKRVLDCINTGKYCPISYPLEPSQRFDYLNLRRLNLDPVENLGH
jgi:hypothetical protein